MIQFEIPQTTNSMIMVIGVGGGGNNAVNYMYEKQFPYINYMICNTDVQVLEKSNVPIKIALGPTLTNGLGAGCDPKIGESATMESKQEIVNILQKDVKMAFITAGMGGGTGTGGAPIVAQICKELGILTVGIITTPFTYEGKKRLQQAHEGIEELKKYVDIIIVVNNDKIREHYGNLSISNAFGKVNDVVVNAIESITNVIYTTGSINLDFADICSVMRDGGVALMGVARASGVDRAFNAAQEALSCPLLNDVDIKGAQHVLINIQTPRGEHEITADEVETIQKQILDKIGGDTDLYNGFYFDDNENTSEIAITLIVTGFNHLKKTEPHNPKLTPIHEESLIINKNIFIDDEENLYAEKRKSEPATDKPNIVDLNPYYKEPFLPAQQFDKTEDFNFKDQNTFLDNAVNENEGKDKQESVADNPSTTDHFFEKEQLDVHTFYQKQNENKNGARFDQFTFNFNKSKIHEQIFLDKDPNTVQYNSNSISSIDKDSQLGTSSSVTQNQHGGVDLKKENEYTQYYAQKRPD